MTLYGVIPNYLCGFPVIATGSLNEEWNRIHMAIIHTGWEDKLPFMTVIWDGHAGIQSVHGRFIRYEDAKGLYSSVMWKERLENWP